jgi:hypothetical protein
MTSLSQPQTPPTGGPAFNGPKTCDASEMLEIHRALRRAFGEATQLVDGVAEGDVKHAAAVARSSTWDEEATIVPAMEHVLTQREENWFLKHGPRVTPADPAFHQPADRRPLRRGRHRRIDEWPSASVRAAARSGR